MRSLVRICNQHRTSLAGLLICGDLTDKGNLDGYRICLEYLVKNLRMNEGIWPTEQIHAVPGNHDVNRTKCDPKGTDVHLKFEPLIDAWVNVGLDVLAAKQCRHTRVSANGHKLDLFSLNSCIGCGERRYLPADVKDKLDALIKSSSAHLDLIWEQLDTPAFIEADVNVVTTTLEQQSDISLGVVVAHHNLLPQALPRFEMYSDVVNGGLVRSRLSQCAHPIIYCHGHIHDDPVEIVTNAKSHRGRLISISVPKFDQGFNVLELDYSRSDVPMGCRVVPFRFQNDGEVRAEAPIRIPLRTIRDAARVTDDLAKSVLQRIGKSLMRLEDVRATLPKPTPQARTVAQVLVDLEWLGFVDIDNRSEEARHWQVRRTDP